MRLTLALVALAGCALDPIEIAPPGRPQAVASADLERARVVLTVPRSPDDGGGLDVVNGYAILREREGSGEGFVPFHHLHAPDASGPVEQVYYDRSAVGGERYRYIAYALAERERMTFGSAGARPAPSEPSAWVAAPPAGEEAPPAIPPPPSVAAAEAAGGTGFQIDLSWDLSPADQPGAGVAYSALRAESPGGPWRPFPGDLGTPSDVDPDTRKKTVDVPGDGATYHYRIYAVPRRGEAVPATEIVSASPAPSWFNVDRLPIAIVLLLMTGLMYLFLFRARSGGPVFIRRIPGVDAIEEAVGRATEMGRPVLYVPGIHEIQNIQTIASLFILGRVAEMVARYDSELLVPCRIPLVATVSEEVVRQGFYDAGRPDAHKPRNIQWISSEQFAYIAGTFGIIHRQRPATNLYLGYFFAESLLLGETGYVTGAIQIAGTAAIPQLPFFIASCDYTLIGEELYAVSAYMTREPKLLSTLKAADAVKAICLIVLVVGAVAALVAPESGLTTWLLEFLSS
jgi:hypothetical protein